MKAKIPSQYIGAIRDILTKNGQTSPISDDDMRTVYTKWLSGCTIKVAAEAVSSARQTLS
jgi:hypothetical protein